MAQRKHFLPSVPILHAVLTMEDGIEQLLMGSSMSIERMFLKTVNPSPKQTLLQHESTLEKSKTAKPYSKFWSLPSHHQSNQQFLTSLRTSKQETKVWSSIANLHNSPPLRPHRYPSFLKTSYWSLINPCIITTSPLSITSFNHCLSLFVPNIEQFQILKNFNMPSLSTTESSKLQSVKPGLKPSSKTSTMVLLPIDKPLWIPQQ